MALNSRLALLAYPSSSAQGTSGYGSTLDLSAAVENLSFSTVSPGGFGTLTALLRLPRLQAPAPALGLFARVVLQAGAGTPWLGELMDPDYGLSQANGDYTQLSALGLGNALRDDPRNWSYSAQTAQQIAFAQLAYHTGGTNNDLTNVISPDNSQLFPDNPSRTISQVYAGRTFEEVLADVALLSGDYAWGTESDPTHRDLAGFPTGRVFARARNLQHVDYTARIGFGDVTALNLRPTATRAYNAVEIRYNNGTGGIASAVALDSRLNSFDLSQGSAPFRYRRYTRDMSSNSLINSAIANSIASTYLNLFQNPTYTGTCTLRSVRDGNGAAIPLWQVRAGGNLFIPELAVQGQQLPKAPTQNVNLFWITQTTYREASNGEQSLDLQLGYVPDDEGVQVARLQLASDALSRGRMVSSVVQALGASMYGPYGFEFSNAIGGAQEGGAVAFPNQAYQAPTSLTLTNIANNNIGALSVTDLTAVGAFIYGSVTATGSGYARGTYQTNGNCLLDVNHESGRFAHHCDVCDEAHQDLSLDPADGHLYLSKCADHEALTVICPNCARRVQEGFNLALTEADEQGVWEHRATQARLIRQMMRAHGLMLR